jgi:hypothetical protein
VGQVRPVIHSVVSQVHEGFLQRCLAGDELVQRDLVPGGQLPTAAALAPRTASTPPGPASTAAP